MTTSQQGLVALPSAGGVTCTSSVLGDNKPTAGLKVRIVCQVAGCGNQLPPGKVYYARHKICWEHSRLRSLVLGGREAVRWCQQCGRFQYLSQFDGDKRSCKYSLRRHNGRRRTLRAVQRLPSPPPMLAMPSVATPGQAAPTHQLAAPAKAPATTLTSDPSLETFAALMMNLPEVDVLGPDWSEESAPPCSVAGLLAAHEQVTQGPPPMPTWQPLMHGCTAGTQGQLLFQALQGATCGPFNNFIATMPHLAPPLTSPSSGDLLTQGTSSHVARPPGRQQPPRTPKSDEELLEFLTHITSLRCLTDDWYHDGSDPPLQPVCLGQQGLGGTVPKNGGAHQGGAVGDACY